MSSDNLQYFPQFLGALQAGLGIQDRFTDANARHRQALLQEQMGALQLQSTLAEQQHRAALRPMELARAQREQQDDLLARRARLIGALDEYGRGGKIDSRLQQEFNQALQAEFGSAIDNDGSGKRFAGFHPAPEGEGHVMLVDVPQEDGGTAVRPVTQNRSSDPADPVMVFDNGFFLKTSEEALQDLAARLGVPPEQARELVDDHNRRARSALRALSTGKGEESWSEPYPLGDSYVQKNLRTGEVRQASSNWRGDGGTGTGGSRRGGYSPSAIEKLARFLAKTYNIDMQTATDRATAYYDGRAKLPAALRREAIKRGLDMGQYDDDDGNPNLGALDAAAGGPKPQPEPAPQPTPAPDSAPGGKRIVAARGNRDPEYQKFYAAYQKALQANNQGVAKKIADRALQSGVIRYQ